VQALGSAAEVQLLGHGDEVLELAQFHDDQGSRGAAVWGALEDRLPTQLIFADADTYSMQHICDFWALLGGGQRDAGWDGAGRPAAHQLAILPDTTHYTIFASPAPAETAGRLLNA